MLNSEDIPNRPAFLKFFFIAKKLKKIIMTGEISKEEFRKNKKFYITRYTKDGKSKAYIIVPFDDGENLYFFDNGEALEGEIYIVRENLPWETLDEAIKRLKRVIMDSWIDIDTGYVIVQDFMD